MASYSILRNGDRHSVVNHRGDVVRTHDTRAHALAHLAALIERGCPVGDYSQRADAAAGPCVRSFAFDEFEFRDEGSGGFTFEGVASVVDTPYPVRDAWGEFHETIKAGAFNKTLRDGSNDIALFVNHDYRALPLATKASGNLRLSVDPHLRVIATLDPSRPSVQETAAAVRGGQARQMSIGFSVPKSRDKWNDDMTERWISEAQLTETSIVWRGANPHTSGGMRALDEILALRVDDMTEDEARRAVAYFAAMLPAGAVEVARALEAGTLTAAGTIEAAAAPAPAAIERTPAGPVVGPMLAALWDARKGTPA